MKLLTKVFTTILLVSVIVWYLGGLGEIGSLMAGADPFYVILGFIVITFDRALMTFKWSYLLRSRGVDLPFFRGMRIYCGSMIWGMFLPITMGTDAIRAYITSRSGLNTNQVIASIVVERMVGFIASLLVGFIGLLILSYREQINDRFAPIWWIGSLVFISVIIIFAASFSRSFFDVIYERMPKRFTTSRLGRRLRELHETYVEYSTSMRSMAIFFVLTFFEQFFSILFAWLSAFALGVDVGIIFMAGVIPLTLLISRLPIAFNGIGVFEGIFILLMALEGISAAEAVSIALIGRIIEILSWFPWWIGLVAENKTFKPPRRLKASGDS